MAHISTNDLFDVDLQVHFMSLIYLTMESIVYNRVSLKEFLNSGGFSKFPGIKVSKNGRIYLTKDGKSAPLMLDAEAGDIIVRGSYARPNDSGYKLLTVLPSTFSSSAVELFKKWASARDIDSRYRLLLQDRGSTYLNYKHDIEATSFPIQLNAFGFIPTMYCIESDPKTAGISYLSLIHI